jgi:signal transduction histidine kinase
MPVQVSSDGVLNKLAAHATLGDAPRAEHEWLAAHGVVMRAEVGEVVVPKGKPVPGIYIFFSGMAALRTDRGAGSHKIYEMAAGGLGGHLAAEYLEVSREYNVELTRNCPVCTGKMVHAMLDRARQFKISDLHDEKLISLGKLAAGLAHELGNPASAAVRSAKLLARSIDAAESAATALGEARLSEEQWRAIRGAVTDCAATSEFAGASVLARADRLDEITNWLEARGLDEACADPLAETGVTIAALDTLATKVQGDALRAAVRWIANGCGLRSLASEIDTATGRIQQLVKSVKGFTFMDHAPASEPIDIRGGIADTFTMLAAKTRAKSVDVALRLPEDLPRALGVGAELNQVWMNLIDNALDAVAAGGHVAVTASADRDRVVVTVTDDGPGIPAEIQGRIFDPFFTWGRARASGSTSCAESCSGTRARSTLSHVPVSRSFASRCRWRGRFPECSPSTPGSCAAFSFRSSHFSVPSSLPSPRSTA